MDIETTNTTQSSNANIAQMENPAVDSQLIREIADRVYALMLRDLKIEKERRVNSRANTSYPYGGRS